MNPLLISHKEKADAQALAIAQVKAKIGRWQRQKIFRKKEMNLLLVSHKEKGLLYRESKFLPRVGDCVDEFYTPAPTVQQVLLWPSIATLRYYDAQDWGYRLGLFEDQDLKSLSVDALVIVD